MSMLMLTTIEAAGTGGCVTKDFDPHSPASSASKAAKMTVCSGRCSLKYLPNANSAAVPDALSSAPLKTSPLRTPM